MNGHSTETVELAYDIYETADTEQDKYPIVFLHEFLWNKYMLRDVADALCDITKRKVYCPDARCHGESPFREQFSIEILAEDIKQFIQDRNLRKVVFVCHSFASSVIYLVLLDMPDLIEKVVMVDYPPFPDNVMESFYEHVYPQFVSQKRLLQSLDPSMTLSAAKRKLRQLSEKSESADIKLYLKKAAYELIKVNDQFKWIKDYQIPIDYARVSFFPCFKARGRSDHGMLFIRGENSSFITDEKFKAILKYNPKATLKTIGDATHLLMYEKTEEFLEAVREFLQ